MTLNSPLCPFWPLCSYNFHNAYCGQELVWHLVASTSFILKPRWLFCCKYRTQCCSYKWSKLKTKDTRLLSFTSANIPVAVEMVLNHDGVLPFSKHNEWCLFLHLTLSDLCYLQNKTKRPETRGPEGAAGVTENLSSPDTGQPQAEASATPDEPLAGASCSPAGSNNNNSSNNYNLVTSLLNLTKSPVSTHTTH